MNNYTISPDASMFRVAVSAAFTAEPVARVLEFWGEQLGTHFEVRFAPFQQVMQTLLDPAGEFAANAHGVNVVLLRARQTGEIEEAVQVARRRDRVPLIVIACDENEVEELYPVAEKWDATAERLGGIPYTQEYFTALGTLLARRITALSLTPYKAIAVDCDDTLWDGICGEDGPLGVRMGQERRTLQRFLREQRAAGMLLCVASKNNEADVRETFAAHPEMPLGWEDFTAARVDWEPKPENLAAIAEELRLGLDSFIFLDDSAKECEEMRDERPEVLTLELPDDAARIPHFLRHVWAFDHAVVTAEDARRAASYEQAREFGSAFESAHTLEEFMASLQLRVMIAPLREEQIARVAQLMQRTNQFNFSTIRRTEAEMRALAATHTCLTVEVADRFGEYGLTGVVIYSQDGGSLDVETFLLSCRVLGRGVEHRVMAHLGELAEDEVRVRFCATPKNEPARLFLESIGNGARFGAHAMRGLEWKPAHVAHSHEAVDQVPREHRFLPFARIANQLSTVAEIQKAMARSGTHLDTRMSDSQRALARIWAELLPAASIHAGDRFFELGGHSLLAVLLISNVREQFGVELPMDDVYSAEMTLGELAAKIEILRESGMDAREYQAMIVQIEALSDEEVRALLGQE